MGEVQVFHYGLMNEVRATEMNGEPWFVAKDVCVYFGDSDHKRSISRLDDDEKMIIPVTDRMGRTQQATAVNESGLYALLFNFQPEQARSKDGGAPIEAHIEERLKKIKAFKRWITHEVIPAIRKHGGYVASKEEDTPELIMARALQVAQATIERHKERLAAAERQIREIAPKAEYADKVLSADNLHTINSIAVHLGVSAIRLNKFLESEGWIYRQGGNLYPSFKIRDKGFCDFHIVPYAYDENGNVKTREHLKWTETGRKAIISIWERKTA